MKLNRREKAIINRLFSKEKESVKELYMSDCPDWVIEDRLTFLDSLEVKFNKEEEVENDE